MRRVAAFFQGLETDWVGFRQDDGDFFLQRLLKKIVLLSIVLSKFFVCFVFQCRLEQILPSLGTFPLTFSNVWKPDVRSSSFR